MHSTLECCVFKNTLPLRVLAVVCTMRNEALQNVTGTLRSSYGTLRNRYGK